MSLRNNARNHNQKPVIENNEDFVAAGLKQAAEYEQSMGKKPSSYTPEESVDFASPVDYDSTKKKDVDGINSETGTDSRASAYDDLDDYVYRQNKKRHRSSHHHSSSSVPSLFRKKRRSNHKHKHHHHRHHRRKKRLKKWQKVSIGIISVLMSLIILAIGTVVYLNVNGRTELLSNEKLMIAVPDDVQSQDNGAYITYKGIQYKYNENITSILCMGVDRQVLGDVGGHIGTGGNADAIFLITIDTETGDTKLINISRETMTDIAIYSTQGNYIETQKAQLCLAYAYGNGADTSCRNVLVSVKRLFYNIPINSYISLDLQGIGAINDTIGGVTVVSPETVGGIFVEGETYNLKGSLAQSFVQSRSHETAEGNNLRMVRQKVYLESFAKKLIDMTKQDISTPVNVFNGAQPYSCTNIDAAKVTYLAMNAMRGGYNEFEIKSVPGKVKAGDKYAEFHVNEKKFFEMFLSVFYKPVE